MNLNLDIKIIPSKLSGELKLPPSKSIAHRHIICSALAEGVSEISNIAYSQDILASIDAMKALGARFEMGKDCIKVYGIGNKIKELELDDEVSDKEKINKLETEDMAVGEMDTENLVFGEKTAEGLDSRKLDNKDYIEKLVINCRESGSTIRFLLPILTIFNKKFHIQAQGRLLKRPMDPYFKIFDMEGISYQKNQEEILIEGGKGLRSEKFYMDGKISSQFISGMMFLLPLLNHDSEIIIENKLESKSYVDLTIDCLSKYGIEIENNEYKSFKIKANQSYISRDSYIEGDYSQAAFFAVANALGNEVDILGVSESSLQGDRKILDLLKNFGASVNFVDYLEFEDLDLEKNIDNELKNKESSLGEKSNRKKLLIRQGRKNGYSFDGSDIPDIVPIVALLASLSKGKTRISNISRLRIKESDRLEAVDCELNKLGANIKSGEDFLEINGVENLNGGVIVDSHKDHRIAMMLAIATTVCREAIIIKDADSVSKSFPNFWEKYRELGGIYECDLG